MVLTVGHAWYPHRALGRRSWSRLMTERGVMLAVWRPASGASAVGTRCAENRSSPSACSFRFNARRARGRVVLRYALASSPTHSLPAHFHANGLRRRARVITTALARGTTVGGATPWHSLRKKAVVVPDPKTGQTSRGEWTTARATSTAMVALTHDPSEKRKWMQALLTAGPLAPGCVHSRFYFYTWPAKWKMTFRPDHRTTIDLLLTTAPLCFVPITTADHSKSTTTLLDS